MSEDAAASAEATPFDAPFDLEFDEPPAGLFTPDSAADAADAASADSAANAALSLSLSAEELLRLSTHSWKFYCTTHFARTCAMPFAAMHENMWELFEANEAQLISLMCFRGSGKTTHIRLFVSRRVALGLSQTIMIVGASQDHAKKSVGWLRDQIDHNTAWASLFGLKRGRVWTDERLEIRHTLLGLTINVAAFGMLGNIRGLNVNDRRPDLIVVDDPNDEENTATAPQREKVKALFFGSLLNSLAPESEAPHRKMILAQTPFDADDLVHVCERDPEWFSRRYSCFTADESTWPERWTTAQLKRAKASYIARGDLSLWSREMEVSIISDVSKPFRTEWLRYWSPDELPASLVYFMAIDPVPPPSEREQLEALRNKDFECIVVVGFDPATGRIYLLEYSFNKGHDPNWTITEVFRLWDKWRGQGAGVASIRVEATAYQRTLAWMLGQAMRAKGRYLPINAVSDQRKKAYRILQAIRELASGQQLWVSPKHLEFISQYSYYPAVQHDDIIDAVAAAIEEALEHGPAFAGVEGVVRPAELLPPENWRHAP